MKAQFPTFLAFLIVCAGCASREARPVQGHDYTHRAERQQLRGQPIPVPSVTPYDDTPPLRGVYISGFEKGWAVAVEYWLGNAMVIPEEYQHSPKEIQAWRDGWIAAQNALYEHVRKISGETSPR